MLSSALLLTTNSGGNTSIHKLTVGKDTNADAYGYNRNGDHIYGNLTPAECSVGGVLAPILYLFSYYANDDCDGYIEEVQSNINDIYEREVLPLLKTCKDTFIENEEFNNIVVKSSYCEAKADFTDYGCAEFKLNLAIFIK